LGALTGPMSTGTEKPQVDSHLDAQPRDHQDQMWLCGLRRRISVMCQARSEVAQGKQVQGVHQGQGIHV